MARRLTKRALREELPDYGVLLLESHHGPEFDMEWRTHPFLKIVYVLQGNGVLHHSELQQSFKTGDVLLVPPGTWNRFEDEVGTVVSLYICCISPRLMWFDESLPDRFAVGRLREGGHFANRVAGLMRSMVHAQQQDGPLRRLRLVNDALQLFQVVYRQLEKVERLRSERRQEKQARKSIEDRQRREVIQSYIDELPGRFFEDQNLETVVERLGIPRRTFTQEFAQITGTTWLKFIRRLAIEHAQKRLRETELPIVSIAFECGFQDLSTFYRQFRSHSGLSPAQFRERTGS